MMDDAAFCVDPCGPSSEPVSFLFTYHNEAGLLTEGLESLRSELKAGDEILVYDDASSEKPDPHIPRDLSVMIIRGDGNVGPGQARNRLVQRSVNRWIHFHDSDDLFERGWRLGVSRFFDTRAEMVLTEVRAFGLFAHDRVTGLTPFPCRQSLVRWAIQGAILPAAGTYRRELLDRTGGFRAGLWQSEDMDFGVRASVATSAIGVVSESLALLRARANSRSRQRREVLRCGVSALESLLIEIPAEYRRDVANRAATLAMLLNELGDEEGARNAWRLVAVAGGADLRGRSTWMRMAARVCGLAAAEKSSLKVRRLRERLTGFWGG